MHIWTHRRYFLEPLRCDSHAWPLATRVDLINLYKYSMYLRESTKMVASNVTIHLEFDYNNSTRSTPACARPYCGFLEYGEQEHPHHLRHHHQTQRRQRAPWILPVSRKPRHDTTSTLASRLMLGGFSDNGTLSPTCSRFRDPGSKPVRHHTLLKARMRLGRIPSVLSGERPRLGGSITQPAHNGTRDNSRGISSAAAGGIRQIAMGT